MTLTVPERNFGYLVGDVIVTEVVVTTRTNAAIDQRFLPAPGPLNASIELRRVDLHETLANGERKTVLRMEYQSFFAPDHVMLAELPAYDLRFASALVHVPAWPFHVSPLRVPQRSVDDLADLHGNPVLAPISAAPSLAGLLVSIVIAVAAAILVAGVQGWLPGFSRKRQPFAGAARRIARLAPTDMDIALRALLHAFDATDGRRVFPEDLDIFLLRHTAFGSLRSEITRFFELSRRHFFAPSRCGQEAGQDFAGLVLLARALRRAERRW